MPEVTENTLRRFWSQYFRGKALEQHVQWTLQHWDKVKDGILPTRESLKCCEHARMNNCVCFASRWCPFHQLQCIGSHD